MQSSASSCTCSLSSPIAQRPTSRRDWAALPLTPVNSGCASQPDPKTCTHPHLTHKGLLLPPPVSRRSWRGRILPSAAVGFVSGTIGFVRSGLYRLRFYLYWIKHNCTRYKHPKKSRLYWGNSFLKKLNDFPRCHTCTFELKRVEHTRRPGWWRMQGHRQVGRPCRQRNRPSMPLHTNASASRGVKYFLSMKRQGCTSLGPVQGSMTGWDRSMRETWYARGISTIRPRQEIF